MYIAFYQRGATVVSFFSFFFLLCGYCCFIFVFSHCKIQVPARVKNPKIVKSKMVCLFLSSITLYIDIFYNLQLSFSGFNFEKVTANQPHQKQSSEKALVWCSSSQSYKKDSFTEACFLHQSFKKESFSEASVSGSLLKSNESCKVHQKTLI